MLIQDHTARRTFIRLLGTSVSTLGRYTIGCASGAAVTMVVSESLYDAKWASYGTFFVGLFFFLFGERVSSALWQTVMQIAVS